MTIEGGGKVTSILDQFPDHARLIALIIANWTGIESILVRWTAYLLKTDYERSLVIWNESSSLAPKLKLIKRFMHRFMPDDKDRKAIMDLLGEIQSASGLRHKYAHAVYSCDAGAETISISPGTAPGKDQEWIRPTVPLTLDSLRSDLAQLVSLADKAHAIRIESISLTG
jgi:hypothetical protein